jgi:hypothetical protein
MLVSQSELVLVRVAWYLYTMLPHVFGPCHVWLVCFPFWGHAVAQPGRLCQEAGTMRFGLPATRILRQTNLFALKDTQPPVFCFSNKTVCKTLCTEEYLVASLTFVH